MARHGSALAHLAARRKNKRKGATRPGKRRWRAPDLVKRDFPARQLNRKWFGDGTEIPTGEGKLYLASVTDVVSRRIVGFALSGHHDAQLVYGAVAVRGGQVHGVTSQPTSYAHLAVDSTVPEVAALATMTRPTPDDCNSSCRFVVAKALAGAWLD